MKRFFFWAQVALATGYVMTLDMALWYAYAVAVVMAAAAILTTKKIDDGEKGFPAVVGNTLTLIAWGVFIYMQGWLSALAWFVALTATVGVALIPVIKRELSARSA